MVFFTSFLQGPELELIKFSRFIVAPIPLVAWSVILMFFLVGGFRARNDYAKVKLFVVLAIVLVSLVVLVGAAPSFIATDASIQGVVINSQTQAGVAQAHVSVDGFPDLKYNTDSDGNFQITIAKRRRQDEYIIRAQSNGIAAITTVRDADVSKKTAHIELNVPVRGSSVAINLLDGITLRNATTMLADQDNSTPVFKPDCPEAFLKARVRGGLLTASSHAELMQQLSYRLKNSTFNLKIYARKLADRGIYEVTCAK